MKYRVSICGFLFLISVIITNYLFFVHNDEFLAFVMGFISILLWGLWLLFIGIKKGRRDMVEKYTIIEETLDEIP